MNIPDIKPLTDIQDQGHWVWVVSEDSVVGDKDHPPSFTPEGHWEYAPSLKELYAEYRPAFESLRRVYGYVNHKGTKQPSYLRSTSSLPPDE